MTACFVKSREFIWGDPDRFPETVAMVRYMQEYHAVPPGEPPLPPTPHVDGVFHYLHDALGSVIGLVDAAGELVERYTYGSHQGHCTFFDSHAVFRTPFSSGRFNGLSRRAIRPGLEPRSTKPDA